MFHLAAVNLQFVYKHTILFLRGLCVLLSNYRILVAVETSFDYWRLLRGISTCMVHKVRNKN